MPEQERPQIDYYFWLLSDWAYLGGVRLEQMAARHRVPIKHVPLRLPDVYSRTGGLLLCSGPGSDKPTASRNSNAGASASQCLATLSRDTFPPISTWPPAL